MVGRILKRIYLKVIHCRLNRSAILNGKNIGLGRYSSVSLIDGAKKSQVIINDHVDMLGSITVADNGFVEMQEYSKIGAGTKILCVNKVIVGRYTAIGENTVIVDNNNHPVSPAFRKEMRLTPHGSDMRQWKHSVSSPIVIGENTWIGSNVRICKGVKIGDNSVVAACSVITKDVPANSIAAGNPAKIVKNNIDEINDAM